MSKQVQLIPLAVTDLSVKYARPLGNNKILHYRVSAISHIAGLAGDPFKAVAEYIHTNEGLEAVLVENNNPSKGGVLQAEDMTEAVLKGMPQIRKALQKRRVNGSIYQYTEPMSFADIQNEPKSYITRDGVSHKHKPTSRFLVGLNILAHKLGLENLIPRRFQTLVRRVTPVTYLTYCYEAPDEQVAIDTLRQDLRTLHERGLIMGHLSMPSSMTLADTVGAGVPRKVLFCFVVLNQTELLRQVNKNPLEVSRKPYTEFLGIKGEAFEGELAVNLTPGRYEIEQVDVNPADQLTSDKIRQAVLLNYLENVPVVNEVAESQRQLIKAYKEETKDGNMTGPIGMQVHKNHPDVIAKKQMGDFDPDDVR